MKKEKIIGAMATATLLIVLAVLNLTTTKAPEKEGIISAQYPPIVPAEQDTKPKLTMAEAKAQADEVMAYVDETWTSYQVTPAKPPVIHYDVPLSIELQEYTHSLCEEMSVHYPLAIAVMQVESGFDPTKISPKNRNGTDDHGIMQINSGNHKWLEHDFGIKDWYDPEQNILAGVYILSQHTLYQDHHQILMAYNSGPNGAKENFWDKGIYTNAYSEEVLATMEGLKVREQDGTP